MILVSIQEIWVQRLQYRFVIHLNYMYIYKSQVGIIVVVCSRQTKKINKYKKKTKTYCNLVTTYENVQIAYSDSIKSPSEVKTVTLWSL
jgi:hypothetical protein